MGPGLLESLYEKALCHELKLNKIEFENQLSIPIAYKGATLGEHRIEIWLENEVIVELKAVDKMDPVFQAQLLSYL